MSTAPGLMQEKVVLITGAGRGIGRAIALAMADEGAHLVVNDLGTSTQGEGADLTPAMEVVTEIERRGGRGVASYDSVSSWDGAHAIVRTALDAFGKLDVVINNAGILRDAIFFKMTEADFDAVVQVHLKGSFNVSRAAAEHFRKQESGVFLHMTSTTGLIGNLGQANYGAAKLGIVALSKAIALDMARFHVRSNCISPFAWSRMVGTVPTNTPEQAARVERIKQMVPEKIAPLAVALCSERCEVNGQVFVVRNNELFLMSQPRPLRGVQTSDGWTPQSVLERALPAFKPSMFALDKTADVFSWDPV
jgi:NAD(P)-dependent dehydrogenase (short-subunit alcohol dehydrogenase family)